MRTKPVQRPKLRSTLLRWQSRLLSGGFVVFLGSVASKRRRTNGTDHTAAGVDVPLQAIGPPPLVVHLFVLGHRCSGHRVVVPMRVICLIVPNVSRPRIFFRAHRPRAHHSFAHPFDSRTSETGRFVGPCIALPRTLRKQVAEQRRHGEKPIDGRIQHQRATEAFVRE